MIIILYIMVLTFFMSMNSVICLRSCLGFVISSNRPFNDEVIIK
jgi:hypothetical protein